MTDTIASRPQPWRGNEFQKLNGDSPSDPLPPFQVHIPIQGINQEAHPSSQAINLAPFGGVSSFVPPDEPDACYGGKYNTYWTGYKVYFTETCDPTQPRLITNVQTSLATSHDSHVVQPVQEELIAQGYSPQKHLLDGGYVSVDNLLDSRQNDIDLIGPIVENRSWQARQEGGYDLSRFSRDSLVKARTQLVNHTRGMVKSFGKRLPRCSTESFAKKVRPKLPAALRPALEPILDSIQELSERIRSYQREIERLAEEVYPKTQSLRQIKGVGALTALAYVLTLEDPGRFSVSREVGPCLGLVPRRDQSGEHDPQRHITKTGDAFLRRLLVGSAHYILGPFGQDSHLRRWGLRLAERTEKTPRNAPSWWQPASWSCCCMNCGPEAKIIIPFFQPRVKPPRLKS